MITCRELLELLLEFVAEELTEDCRKECCDHVCCCPRCAVVVQTYQITIRMTRQLPCHTVPAHLEQRLREAIARELGEQS